MSTVKTSGKIQVNGVSLYYEKHGTGQHPLLLIPGVLGTLETDFQPQLKYFNNEIFTVVGFDPRGYGKSRPPDRDYPVRYFHRDAADARDLMLALGYDKFSVLGWSDGGNTGAILSAVYPENVRKLVIWGANAYFTSKDFETYEAVRDVDNWSPRLRDTMVSVYGKEYFSNTWNKSLDVAYEIMEKHNGDIYKTELPKIRAPTLILHGVKDFLVAMEHPKYLHENIKGSLLECWEEGKHNLHLRFAEKFNKRVEEFLKNKNKSSL